MKPNIIVVGTIDLSKFEKKEWIAPSINVIKFKTEEIHFFKDKNKRIIGRSANGKIAIISFTYKSGKILEGENWLCSLISEEEHKVIVYPISRTKTSEENFEESLQKVAMLQTLGFKKQFTSPKNASLFYKTR